MFFVQMFMYCLLFVVFLWWAISTFKQFKKSTGSTKLALIAPVIIIAGYFLLTGLFHSCN